MTITLIDDILRLSNGSIICGFLLYRLVFLLFQLFLIFPNIFYFDKINYFISFFQSVILSYYHVFSQQTLLFSLMKHLIFFKFSIFFSVFLPNALPHILYAIRIFCGFSRSLYKRTTFRPYAAVYEVCCFARPVTWILEISYLRKEDSYEKV